MKRRGGIGVAFMLLVAAWGCGAATSGDPGVVIDTLPDGTVHVLNSPEGTWEEGEEWRIVEELSIGSVEAEGPELFSGVSGLVVDDHGRFHVLDRDAKEIRVFDAEGAHVRTYARSGAGPGELGDPIGMTSRSAEIWVADPGNARYAVFDTSGAFVETVPRRLGGYSVPWQGGFDETGRLWEASVTFEEEGPRSVVVTFDEEMFPRDTTYLPRFESESFTLEREGARMSAGVPFNPDLAYTVAPSGHLWLGHGGDYRFAKTTFEGDTLLVVEREYEPEPVTEEEREQAIGNLEWFTRQGGQVDPSRIPDTKPAFIRLSVDSEGRPWVERSYPSPSRQGTRFDVFDPDGRFLGTIESGSRFWPNRVFRGDRIYGTDFDSLGVTYVLRARIARGGE